MRRLIVGANRPMTPLRAGGILILVIALATYFAFTRGNPFTHQFKLEAVFVSANNLKPGSPVRIAGVDVGKVKKVMPLENTTGEGGQARVSMQIEDHGLPIHQDAQLKIRPRIFLEGNFFVDVRPGSPTTKAFKSGDTVPVNQTANPVQFGQILTALQSDTREDLKTFLREYSVNGLRGGGARGFNRSIPYWEPAYKNSALANEATLGTQEGDLHRVLKGQQKTLAALSDDERALKDLITNFNITAGAFAREEQALTEAVPALRDVTVVGPPALRSLNSSLPSLSNFARDALPATRSSGPTIDASMPFIRQARRLISEPELKGLVRDLRPTIPALAKLNKGTVPFLDQSRALSACTTNTLVPFAKTPIPDPDFDESKGLRNDDGEPVDNSGEPFYKQGPRGFVGLAGETRIHDANSPLIRANFSGGNKTLVETGPNETLFGQVAFDIAGTRPRAPQDRPPFRPDIPCELQEPPNIEAAKGSAPTVEEFNAKRGDADDRRRMQTVGKDFVTLLDHLNRLEDGKKSVDPLSNKGKVLDEKLAEIGLERTAQGRIVEKDEQ